jgi:small subunit ribosomal protein S1
MAEAETLNPSRDDFAAMLDASFNEETNAEGSVVKGKIIAIENDLAIIDVGLKTEGRVPLKRIPHPRPRTRNSSSAMKSKSCRAHRKRHGRSHAVARQGPPRGKLGPSREVVRTTTSASTASSSTASRAASPSTWTAPLRSCRQPGRHPPGARRLPADEHDAAVPDPEDGQAPRQHRRLAPHDLEETRAEQRSELVQNLAEGQVVEGVVKNITDYGAFVDLGGIDGLLHVTDMAWRASTIRPRSCRSARPSRSRSSASTRTPSASLGMKQLESDPWEGIEAKYPVGMRVTGRVTNITDYGAFVELEPGIEGLIHVSEMSWTKKNVHPGKIVSTSPGSRSGRARSRPGQAPHFARPQADHRQPVGSRSQSATRPAPTSKAKSRTSPSSACSSASKAMSTAWFTSPTSTGTVRRRGHRGLQQGRRGQGHRA